MACRKHFEEIIWWSRVKLRVRARVSEKGKKRKREMGMGNEWWKLIWKINILPWKNWFVACYIECIIFIIITINNNNNKNSLHHCNTIYLWNYNIMLLCYYVIELLQYRCTIILLYHSTIIPPHYHLCKEPTPLHHERNLPIPPKPRELTWIPSETQQDNSYIYIYILTNSLLLSSFIIYSSLYNNLLTIL